ncbi:peroxidasin homolog isoform X3 [Apostichopus japonicus]|uniref:peroxidasin homolog isoform X3 n=1 Tax=Stichopus japonicus TaxID=307972 RepID=UPI003AB300A7
MELGKIFLLLMAIGLPYLSLSVACPHRCVCLRTTIRCMHLGLNRVPSVPATTKILDLRFNQISEIQPGTFRNLPELTTLLLNNNKITRIVNGAFSGLSNLEYLYLFKNEISEIGSEAFEGLESLTQLYLYSNNITTIYPNTFSNLPSLDRLRLDGNNLLCNCELIWLVQMLKSASRTQNTQAAATCSKPARLVGRNLVELDAEELNCRIPHITVPPSDVSTPEGSNVYFRCAAIGEPKPEIIWFNNGIDITEKMTSDNRIHILRDGTLMITNAGSEDVGEYECMARNSAGEVKSPAYSLSLVNQTKPSAIINTRNVEVQKGASAIISCSVRGNPTPQITWRKDGQNVLQDQRFRILRNGSLYITRVKEGDQGLFVLEASNSRGSSSDSTNLIVLIVPTFVREPQSVTVLEGGTVEVHCSATGYPQPDIHWRKNGATLPNDPRYMIMGGMALRVVRAIQSDTGDYTCLAVNKAGQNQAEASVVVKQREPPIFTQSPQDLDVEVGAFIRLPCAAAGDPTPIITWSKDGVQITDSTKFGVTEDGLLIRDVGKDDEGRYQCAARNSIGYIATHMELDVTMLSFDSEGDVFVNETFQQAQEDVDRAIKGTIDRLFDSTRHRTPSDLLQIFKFPSTDALNIARAAEVFELTIELIHQKIQDGESVNLTDVDIRFNDLVSPFYVSLIANYSGCTTFRKNVDCSDICFHKKYRTYDGTCNNLQHKEWGASLTPFQRFVKPVYENGLSTPVGWNSSKLYFGYPKPKSREVSSKILATKSVTDHPNYSHMLMQWGQFLDHDIDLVVPSLSRAQFKDGIECKDTCDNEPPCFPLEVPEDDPRIQRHQCMEFTRSSAVCGSGSTSAFFDFIMPREQMNSLTSYIDASNVYGSSKELAEKLRDTSRENHGRLRVGRDDGTRNPFLPFNDDFPIDCDRDESESPIPCFLAGDVRANEQVGLTAMHTLWMREHNRIADDLYDINPHWNDETLYHEARKIVGAAMQHITYKFWLPKVIGPTGMDILGKYEDYDPTVDASIANVFATSAFRFGHGLIQPILRRLNESFETSEYGDLPLHKAFFSPFRLVEEGGIDPILRGLYATPLKQPSPDHMMNSELTEKLFHMAHAIALDLGALNIHRGRDHALPPYNEWRKFCGLPVARTFDDFADEIKSNTVRDKMEDVYGHPGNVDLFVGGMAEDPVDGALIGPTLSCILAKQFKRLRDGDRFWYENMGVFSPGQLTQIKQISLARVLCDNGNTISRVNDDAFLFISNLNEYKKCREIPSIDLGMWAECPEELNSLSTYPSPSLGYSDLYINSLTVGPVRSRRSIGDTVEAYGSKNVSRTTAKSEKETVVTAKQSKSEEVKEVNEDVEQRLKSLENKLEVMMSAVVSMQDSISTLSEELSSTRKHRKRRTGN